MLMTKTYAARSARTCFAKITYAAHNAKPKQAPVRAKRAPPAKRFSLGFSKSNELLLGRLAMVGVATSIIGELITGKGAIAQLGLETGLPVMQINAGILFTIAFNMIAAVSPTTGKFIVDDDDDDARPDGVLQDPRINLLDWRRFFGVKKFGFTKENELFVGRVAQLGFAISLLGENFTHKGILAQFGRDASGDRVDSLLVFFIFFLLFAAIGDDGSD